jgi:hypothetical protein
MRCMLSKVVQIAVLVPERVDFGSDSVVGALGSVRRQAELCSVILTET